MFKTIIEFMDGTIREYPTRHITRTDISVNSFEIPFIKEGKKE